MPDSNSSVIVRSLYIYPIKSCRGVEVESLDFDSMGAIGDRRFMLVDETGVFLSQRKTPDMAYIRPTLLIDRLEVHYKDNQELSVPFNQKGNIAKVSVWGDELLASDCGDEAAAWFSKHLNIQCRLVQITEESVRVVDKDYSTSEDRVAFSDGYPLLVVNQKSIDFLSNELGRDIGAARFRPNIVVEGGNPFDELSWSTLGCVGDSTSHLQLVKPCERCIIPMRNPDTLQKESDLTELLNQVCRINSKIIFGQNALLEGMDSLRVGEQLAVNPQG